jgi:hypothetical protein
VITLWRVEDAGVITLWRVEGAGVIMASVHI